MLNKPTNWDNYISDPSHYFETVIRVGNSEYDYDDIFSLTASLNLYGDEYSVGGVCMNQYDAVLCGVTANAIPKYSAVSIWTRLCKDSTHKTSWIPKGVFYTKKPTYDPESETVTITGYDAMHLTEQVPFGPGSTISTWNNPTLREVASLIVNGTTTSKISSNWGGIGIQLEDATQISNTLTMSAPPYGYTVREILKDIAIACGGNWTIAFSGTYPNQVSKLRLVGINELPTYTFNLLSDESDNALLFGDIALIV